MKVTTSIGQELPSTPPTYSWEYISRTEGMWRDANANSSSRFITLYSVDKPVVLFAGRGSFSPALESVWRGARFVPASETIVIKFEPEP